MNICARWKRVLSMVLQSALFSPSPGALRISNRNRAPFQGSGGYANLVGGSTVFQLVGPGTTGATGFDGSTAGSSLVGVPPGPGPVVFVSSKASKSCLIGIDCKILPRMTPLSSPKL